MKWMRIAVLVVLAAGVVAFAGVGRPDSAGGAAKPVGGITVTGAGTITSVPDEATFTVGVQTQGSTAREALAANSEQMQRVIDAVRLGGRVEGRHPDSGRVRLGQLLRRQPDRRVQREQLGARHDSRPVPSGQGAGRGLERRANQVYGPSLSRSDHDALEKKALRDAVGEARTKAEALAKAAGVSLGRVTAITEGSSGGAGPYRRDRLRLAKADAPIEPGTQDIQASVTVTFAIA